MTEDAHLMNHNVKVFSLAVTDSGNKKQQISMDLRICLRSLQGREGRDNWAKHLLWPLWMAGVEIKLDEDGVTDSSAKHHKDLKNNHEQHKYGNNGIHNAIHISCP